MRCKNARHVVLTNKPHDAFEIDLQHHSHFPEGSHKGCRYHCLLGRVVEDFFFSILRSISITF